jgi:hypothetical protein
MRSNAQARSGATGKRLRLPSVFEIIADQTQPPVLVLSTLLDFLGSDPFLERSDTAGLLLTKRRTLDYSIRKAAATLGVDPTTWAYWEHGRVILFRKYRGLVANLLGLPEAEVDRVVSASWISSTRKKAARQGAEIYAAAHPDGETFQKPFSERRSSDG